LAEASTYLTANLTSIKSTETVHTISNGVDELNSLVNDLVDDSFNTALAGLSAVEMKREVDSETAWGKKITAVRQMIADLLGVDIEQISYDLVQQWASNGTLKSLGTASTSADTLDVMAAAIRENGTEVADTAAAK